MHIAVEDGAGGNVAVVSDSPVMFKQRTCIDDAVAAYLSTSIDYSTMHHDSACADGGMTRNMRARRDDGWQFKTKCSDLLIEADAVVGCVNLAHGNKDILIRVGKFRQIIVRGDNGIAEMTGIHFLWHANQPGNFVSTVLLDHINTRMGVTTGPN